MCLFWAWFGDLNTNLFIYVFIYLFIISISISTVNTILTVNIKHKNAKCINSFFLGNVLRGVTLSKF